MEAVLSGIRESAVGLLIDQLAVDDPVDHCINAGIKKSSRSYEAIPLRIKDIDRKSVH